MQGITTSPKLCKTIYHMSTDGKHTQLECGSGCPIAL